jgi:LIVCS family branched-chain amino acid:cation transporter
MLNGFARGPYAYLSDTFFAHLQFCALSNDLLTLHQKNHIMGLLGTVLTPFLLLAIAMIAIFGLMYGEFPANAGENAWFAFQNGFLQGYQTMDLLAAFFFSQFVMQQLSKRLAEKGQEDHLLPIFCKASLVGITALSSVYVILVLLGTLYAPMLNGVPPQEMLGLIAIESLGSYAAPCVCLAIALACLTTAIVLTSLFADFIRDKVTGGKLGNRSALLITLAIGFTVSTLDFNGIARFIGPLLEMIYPALIAITIINIALKLFKAPKPSHEHTTANRS